MMNSQIGEKGSRHQGTLPNVRPHSKRKSQITSETFAFSLFPSSIQRGPGACALLSNGNSSRCSQKASARLRKARRGGWAAFPTNQVSGILDFGTCEMSVTSTILSSYLY